jgi:hypothetical protein
MFFCPFRILKELEESQLRKEQEFKIELQKVKREAALESKQTEQLRNQLKANNNLISVKEGQVPN